MTTQKLRSYIFTFFAKILCHKKLLSRSHNAQNMEITSRAQVFFFTFVFCKLQGSQRMVFKILWLCKKIKASVFNFTKSLFLRYVVRFSLVGDISSKMNGLVIIREWFRCSNCYSFKAKQSGHSATVSNYFFFINLNYYRRSYTFVTQLHTGLSHNPFYRVRLENLKPCT